MTAATPSDFSGARTPRMAGLRDAALISVLLAMLAGAAAWFWLALIGAQRGVFEALVCVAPALLATGLAFTSQTDRRQYVVRLLACSTMLPILLMMWAGSQDAGAGTAYASAFPTLAWMARPWMYFSACAAIGTGLFVAAIWWLAASVTRIEPESGTSRIGAYPLGQTLQSLSAAGVPVDVAAGAQAGQWVLKIRLPAALGRSHRVLLDIDDRAGQVLVREHLAATSAAPVNADEASLRSLGDSPFDPSRPDAQGISSRTTQTTMIEPDKLGAVRLEVIGTSLRLQGPAPTEPEAIVTLLCALVTRSGYAWQPVLGRLS